MDADILDLVALWHTARDEFFKFVLTRRGADRRWKLRRNTRDAYRSATSQFIYGAEDLARAGFEPPRPWEATSADARAYKQAMLFAGRADATINQRLAGLKVFYNYIRDNYRIPRRPQLEALVRAGVLWPDPEDPQRLSLLNPEQNNPFNSSKTERLKVEPFGRAKFPTRREMDKIFKSIDLTTLNGMRDYALLYTIITTTRRISEVRLIKWGDIKTQDDGQRYYGYIGKGRIEGRSLIGPGAWEAIETYLRAAGRLDRMKPDHYLFIQQGSGRVQKYKCNPRRPLSYSTCRTMLKKYGLAAGIDDELVHLHALRHRGLHNRLEDQKRNGGVADLIALRDTAGHKSVSTTEIYIHRTDQHLEDRYLEAAEAAHARDLPVIEIS
jgi:site-specific recombinase XerD